MRTYLEEGVLLLALETVRTENLETAGRFLARETLVVALEELEDVLDGDGLDVDLLLVVQVLSLELNLEGRRQFDCGVKRLGFDGEPGTCQQAHLAKKRCELAVRKRGKSGKSLREGPLSSS